MRRRTRGAYTMLTIWGALDDIPDDPEFICDLIDETPAGWRVVRQRLIEAGVLHPIRGYLIVT